jgi:transcription elongation GreA/GreB family factor
VSRAFVKESDGRELDLELPELRISPQRNFVTAQGFELIEAEVRRLTEALAEARADGDTAAAALHGRDLRYWSARRATAEIVPLPAEPGPVRFGSRVTLAHADGRRSRYQIVGEDEASPAQGTISYASPLAVALRGRTTGDEVQTGTETLEILAVEP